MCQRRACDDEMGDVKKIKNKNRKFQAILSNYLVYKCVILV